MWRARFEDNMLAQKVDKLWDEVKPLYDELHKYVRYQLRNLHANNIDKTSEFIPAHLLGNMWVSHHFDLNSLSMSQEIYFLRRLKTGFIFTIA